MVMNKQTSRKGQLSYDFLTCSESIRLAGLAVYLFIYISLPLLEQLFQIFKQPCLPLRCKPSKPYLKT